MQPLQRLDPQVLDRLNSKDEGHLTRINDILTNSDGSGAAGRESSCIHGPQNRSPRHPVVNFPASSSVFQV